jgi:hypothetical protein
MVALAAHSSIILAEVYSCRRDRQRWEDSKITRRGLVVKCKLSVDACPYYPILKCSLCYSNQTSQQLGCRPKTVLGHFHAILCCPRSGSGAWRDKIRPGGGDGQKMPEKVRGLFYRGNKEED